jgi:ArsR family transcriptional regulator, arsenate/arsenite/antimonite-responsive transcriptional repressor / arsenate reductase (thioredoxin)
LTQASLAERLPAVESASREERARRHAALGDATRVAIVDELTSSDRTSLELQHALDLPSNLLAYHLDVLEHAALITRCQSSGDRRRRYVCLRRDGLSDLLPQPSVTAQPAFFVCTHNSARSQLAAALWRQLTSAAASSAGTHPAPHVNPGAVAAGRRAGLDIGDAHPRKLTDARDLPELVVTVCDRAHEELDVEPAWLHWSVPDPVPLGTSNAFDATVVDLRERIGALVGHDPVIA